MKFGGERVAKGMPSGVCSAAVHTGPSCGSSTTLYFERRQRLTITNGEVNFDAAFTPVKHFALPRRGYIHQVRTDSRLDQVRLIFAFGRIVRTWCSKGFCFYPPKTEAGLRTVPISTWLASLLREYRTRSAGVGLVFPSTAGTPLNKANVRKRVWMPLLERAQVRYRDMYSLRWTFVSLARASGEAAFNVSRLIGHARSTIVDAVYAHTVESALARVSERVTERIGLTPPTLPVPPAPPPAARQ